MQKSFLQRSHGLVFPETNAHFDLFMPWCLICICLKALFSGSSTYLPFKAVNHSVWAFKSSSIPKSVIPRDDTLGCPKNTVFPWLCTSWEETCRKLDELCVVQLVAQQSDSDCVLLLSFLLRLSQGLRMIFWCQNKKTNTQYGND